MKWRFTLNNTIAGELIMPHSPVNWIDSMFSLKRDPVYHGIFYDYNVTLEFAQQAYFYLKKIYQAQGINAIVTIKIEVQCCETCDYDDFYDGVMDLSAWKEQCGDYCSVSLPVTNDNNLMAWRNNTEKKVNPLALRSVSFLNTVTYDLTSITFANGITQLAINLNGIVIPDVPGNFYITIQTFIVGLSKLTGDGWKMIAGTQKIQCVSNNIYTALTFIDTDNTDYSFTPTSVGNGLGTALTPYKALNANALANAPKYGAIYIIPAKGILKISEINATTPRGGRMIQYTFSVVTTSFSGTSPIPSVLCFADWFPGFTSTPQNVLQTITPNTDSVAKAGDGQIPGGGSPANAPGFVGAPYTPIFTAQTGGTYKVNYVFDILAKYAAIITRGNYDSHTGFTNANIAVSLCVIKSNYTTLKTYSGVTDANTFGAQIAADMATKLSSSLVYGNLSIAVFNSSNQSNGLYYFKGLFHSATDLPDALINTPGLIDAINAHEGQTFLVSYGFGIIQQKLSTNSGNYSGADNPTLCNKSVEQFDFGGVGTMTNARYYSGGEFMYSISAGTLFNFADGTDAAAQLSLLDPWIGDPLPANNMVLFTNNHIVEVTLTGLTTEAQLANAISNAVVAAGINFPLSNVTVYKNATTLGGTAIAGVFSDLYDLYTALQTEVMGYEWYMDNDSGQLYATLVTGGDIIVFNNGSGLLEYKIGSIWQQQEFYNRLIAYAPVPAKPQNNFIEFPLEDGGTFENLTPTLEENDQIVIDILLGHGGIEYDMVDGTTMDISFAQWLEIISHDFNIALDTSFVPTSAPLLLINETLSRINEIITDGAFVVKSDYFGRTDSQPYTSGADGPGSLEAVTNGLYLRNIANFKFNLSFKDLFNGLNAIHCLGVGIEQDTVRGGSNQWVRIEPAQYFYDENNIMLTCDKILTINKKVSSEKLYNQFQFGFSKWEAEQGGGLDEFNTKREYINYINTLRNSWSQVCDLIASGYAIEITRQQQGLTNTNDWRFDNDTFIICLKRLDGTISVEQGADCMDVANTTNLIDPASTYNYRISPIHNLFRWMKLLFTSFANPNDTKSVLTFAKGEGNYFMASRLLSGTVDELGVISESDAITIATINGSSPDALPIFKNEEWEFEYPLSLKDFLTIQAKPTGVILVACGTCKTFDNCFLTQLDYDPNEGKAKFTVIPAFE